ncbi:MAG: hypothetical protein ACRDZX_11745 [Acidimicrobiales bacterium]
MPQPERPAPGSPSFVGATAEARARLRDAEDFLEVAKRSDNPGVIATNAVRSAIAAADAMCCLALRQRSASADHPAAASMLARVDTKVAASLKRLLDRKNQAAYEARDIAVGDAATCMRQATSILEAARQRVQAI